MIPARRGAVAIMLLSLCGIELGPVNPRAESSEPEVVPVRQKCAPYVPVKGRRKLSRRLRRIERSKQRRPA